jgi:hypothetical protein
MTTTPKKIHRRIIKTRRKLNACRSRLRRRGVADAPRQRFAEQCRESVSSQREADRIELNPP